MMIKVNSLMGKIGNAIEEQNPGASEENLGAIFNNLLSDGMLKSSFTMKEKLDLFKAERGDEYFDKLCQNPSFNDMFNSFIDKHVDVIKTQNSDTLRANIEKLVPDLDTEDFNAFVYRIQNQG